MYSTCWITILCASAQPMLNYNSPQLCSAGSMENSLCGCAAHDGLQVKNTHAAILSQNIHILNPACRIGTSNYPWSHAPPLRSPAAQRADNSRHLESKPRCKQGHGRCNNARTSETEGDLAAPCNRLLNSFCPRLSKPHPRIHFGPSSC